MYESKSREAWRIASEMTANLMNMQPRPEGMPAIHPAELNIWKQIDAEAETQRAKAAGIDTDMTVDQLASWAVPGFKRPRKGKRTSKE